MPRKNLIRSNQWAYHVTSRSNNKEWFYIPIDLTWRILTDALAESAYRYGAEIWTLVLMSNHFHAILFTPEGNLDLVMQYFISKATRAIQKEAKRINHIFGGRYKWSLLDSAFALACAYKYDYRNPVRAQICKSVEDYAFSTLNDLSSPLALSEGVDPYWKLIPRELPNRLRWLNAPTPKEREALVGAALRRKKFQFSTNSNVQRDLRNLRASYFPEDI
jgi:putative transposase